MVVRDQSVPAARSLGERLRDLREREYGRLTQEQLARVLGSPDRLSVATVSLWEKPGSDRLPPPQRLATYARLFCTSRSFSAGEPRLLPDDELTDQERQAESALYTELLALRDRAQSADATPAMPGERNSIWHFPDARAISIVCSDASDPPSYADPDNPNYSRYARYADLDALVEVFGQTRADNPASMVRILPIESLSLDFALNDLIIIGSAAVYDAAPWFAQDIPLPVIRSTAGLPAFSASVANETREFASIFDGKILREDVGMIAQGPHPNIPQRRVTMLTGITSRGVHGAALCFTSRIRNANEKYLNDIFGSAETFCILMRVPVRNNAALPPNLSRDDIRLYEWSAETGARW